MNQGLKKYSKTVKYDVGNAGSISVNLNKCYSNTHVIIPLYQSNYKDPINLSLTFSLKTKETDSKNTWEFGIGNRLNLYKNFLDDTQVIEVENCDSSITTFYRVDVNELPFRSFESSDYIERSYNFSDEVYYYDGNDNRYTYYRNIENSFDDVRTFDFKYPKEFLLKKGNYQPYTINLDSAGDISSIAGRSGEIVTFIKNSDGLVEKINITRPTETGDVLYRTIDLIYSNGYLTEINHVFNNNVDANYTVSYCLDQINNTYTVKDNVSNYSIKLELDNDLNVNKIIEGYNDNYLNSKYITINYESNNKTIVTDYKGDATQYYFTSNSNDIELNPFTGSYQYLPLYESLSNTMSRAYNYDEITGNLLYDSGIQIVNNNFINNNLISNGYFYDGYDYFEFNTSQPSTDIIYIVDNIFNIDFGGYAILLDNDCNKVTQIISFMGTELVYLTLNVWGRSYYDSSSYDIVHGKVSINLYDGENIIKEESIEFKGDTNHWIFKSVGINSNDYYDKIEIVLESINNNSFMFSGLTLLEKPYEGQYYYSDDNKLIKFVKNGTFYGSDYTDDKKLNLRYKNGEFTNFIYDSNNNLIRKDSSKGISVNYTYDDKNNITKVVTQIGDSGKYIETNTVYNENNVTKLNHEVVTKEINSENKTSEYSYNLLTRLLDSKTNPNNSQETFKYNDFDQIKESNISLYLSSEKIDYTYFDDLTLKSIKHSNGNEFSYIYDSEGKIKTINLINNNVTTEIVSYVYQNEEDNNSTGIHTGNIKVKKNGQNGDEYYFTYDNRERLTNVSLKRSGETSQIELYKYEYNDIDLLVKYNDYVNNYNITYEYDDYLNLIKETDSRGFSNKVNLNNENKIISKEINFNDKTFIESYSYPERTYSETTDAKLNKLKHISNNEELNKINNKAYFALFNEDNNNLEFEYGDPYKPQKSIINTAYGSDIPRLNSTNFSYIDMSLTNNLLGYSFSVFNITNSKASIMFWFKPCDEADSNILFSVGKSETENSFIVKFSSGGGLDVHMSNGSNLNGKFLFNTDNLVLDNEWNYFGFSWEYMYVEGNNPEVFNITICLNGVCKEYMTSEGYVFTFDTQYPLFNIGGIRNDGVINNNRRFNGLISTIIAVPGKYIQRNEIYEYYKRTKDILFSNVVTDDILSVSSVNNYNFSSLINDNSDIIPLNNDLNSYKGVKPSYLKQRNYSKYDNDPYFTFNKEINRYAFCANNGSIMYEYNFTDSGLISLNVYITETNDKNTIFEIDTLNDIISLYRDNNHKLHMKINNLDILTSLNVNNNEWSNIVLYYYDNGKSGDKEIFDFELHVGSQYEMITYIECYAFNNIKLYVGSESLNETNYMCGNIEMLYISNNTQITPTQIREKTKVNTFIKKNDFFGLPVEKLISTNETEIIKHEYQYTSGINNKENRVGTLINKETITLKDSVLNYTYEYDNNGNLLYVYNGNALVKEYMYNYKNELIQEDSIDASVLVSYEYGTNGNIISKTTDYYGDNPYINSYTFEYNDIHSKDILTKVTKNNVSNNILYNDSFFGNPTRLLINDNNYILEWTGKRLSKVILSTNEYYEYKYNSLGERISKKYINLITGYIESTYYYDNGKLIREDYNDTIKGETENKFFGYDDSGLLQYTIINDNKYYYIRNIFNTIIGLTDESGNLITKYLYDAYGNIIDIIGNIALGNSNPFKYKGYYYDSEIKLYYCKTRYYNPELCRFISPDSIEYLNPESANGLNLYCYCYNNPIMYIDPNGYFTIGSLVFSFLISVSFEILEDALDGELFTDDSHDWKDYLGAGISGLFGGLSQVGSTKIMKFGSQLAFSLAGGLTDAAISGDLKENGFWNTVGNITVSTIVSAGISELSTNIYSKIKVKNLRNLRNNKANKILGKMGITAKIGETSNATLSKIIKDSKCLGTIAADYIPSSIIGGIISMGWGRFFDGRCF